MKRKKTRCLLLKVCLQKHESCVWNKNYFGKLFPKLCYPYKFPQKHTLTREIRMFKPNYIETRSHVSEWPLKLLDSPFVSQGLFPSATKTQKHLSMEGLRSFHINLYYGSAFLDIWPGYNTQQLQIWVPRSLQKKRQWNIACKLLRRQSTCTYLHKHWWPEKMCFVGINRIISINN